MVWYGSELKYEFTFITVTHYELYEQMLSDKDLDINKSKVYNKCFIWDTVIIIIRTLMFDFERYHFCFRKEEVKEEGRNLWQYENLDINQSLLLVHCIFCY